MLPATANGPLEGNWEAIPRPLGAIGPDRPQDHGPHFVDVVHHDVVDHRPLLLRVSDFHLYDISLRFNQRNG